MSDNCPNCGHPLDDFFKDKIKVELKEEFKREKQQQFIELSGKIDQKELEIAKLKNDSENNKELLRAQIKQEISEENKQKEMELKKDKIELQGEINSLKKNKDKEISLAVGQALQKQETKLDTEKKLETTEKDNEIASLKKLIKELEEKSNQKSQQAQGEVGEILIEKTLKIEFPIDHIVEVPKGQNGADISHYVRDTSENDLGLIYIESKYAKKFSSNWIKKLKDDMKNKKADFGVLVTLDIPENFKQYEEDDLFICGFHNYYLAVKFLRGRIIALARQNTLEANRSSERLVYDYVTGREFAQWMRGMIDFLKEQQLQLETDKTQAKKSFGTRQAQIDKIIESHMTLAGHFKGLGSVNDFNMLDEATSPNLIENNN